MFTVQYIPLSKIKPDHYPRMTAQIRKLRSKMLDGMNLVVVRKNRKDGSYVILLGNERYEYLRKHTKKLVAPCLVDESRGKSQVRAWFHQLRNKRLLSHFPGIKPGQLTPAALSITRTFLKEEPRFKQLSRRQQVQVLSQAVRYKRTVISAMKAKVGQLVSK
ncbi:hypothetical protein EDM56_15365 [Brevibacillus fluminis]|uniref:ParB/Sulfiredoxin domain-containing protein n=1 Tax=Brevibacillus fluminis TaxID=511487 RepID=A0A3M8DG47_9BACL|nr:hypothetical protein [Brevibacillus fluminis]RNB87072.1 hypothetical protein EDM56_15365 [Brevibacillus fluminis]